MSDERLQHLYLSSGLSLTFDYATLFRIDEGCRCSGNYRFQALSQTDMNKKVLLIKKGHASVEKRDDFSTVFCILVEIYPEPLMEHDFFDMYAIDIGRKEDRSNRR
jgi:hypothetical protein